MEQKVGKDEKLESFEMLSLNLKIFCLSLNEPSEVGSSFWVWKVQEEVRKFN